MTTLDEAKKAINDFFSDRSRSVRETRQGLEELSDDITTSIETLLEDERRENDGAIADDELD